jgi:uncharacterized protein YjbI with pentapeptide repeats
MKKLTANTLKSMYKSGERDFAQTNLSNLMLSGINLSGSNFKGANLQSTDLSHADLSETCLDLADLYQSNLTNAKLDRASLQLANLHKSNLNHATLIETNLHKSKLISSSLQQTNLINSNLTEAYLSLSDLEQAQIHDCCLYKADLNGIKPKQASFKGSDLRQISLVNKFFLKGAFYDFNTLFDSEFDPISAGMQIILEPEKVTITIEEVLATLNYLSQCSNQFLGNKITLKYWQSSRPNDDWLKQFEIDRSTKATFAGEITGTITAEQLKAIQTWSNLFIDYCSQVIVDFAAIVQKHQLLVLSKI